MKIKATKKEFKGLNVLRVSAGALQNLLMNREPFAYSSGVYGWACDYYQMNGFIISAGYNPIGQKANYEIINAYENNARAILDNQETNHETKTLQLETLINDFEGDMLSLFNREGVTF